MGKLFFRILICLSVFSFCLYSYLDQQNRCTQLKMKLPKLKKEIAAIQETNATLAYHIACFESPENLLALASQPQYSHLKYPYSEEILAARVGSVAPAEGIQADVASSRVKAVVLGTTP